MLSRRSVRTGLLSACLLAVPAWGAVINVTTSDDGIGIPGVSLREAVDFANSDADDSVINLVAGETYVLTICGDGEDANQVGDLDHDPDDSTERLTINGNGATIRQDCPDRVLDGIHEDGILQLEDVTITGGDAQASDGGGVRSVGLLELYGVTVTGNATGGIFVGDEDGDIDGVLLIVHDSTISLNQEYGARSEESGAVIVNSQIVDNVGHGLVPDCGSLELTLSRVEGNMDRGVNGVDSLVTVTDSTVRDNGSDGVRTTSPGAGLGVFLRIIGSTLEGNGGSGVDCAACDPLLVDNSTVSGNARGVTSTQEVPVELIHATIIENTGANVETETGEVTATASVIALSVGFIDCNLGGALVSNGYNFDSDGTCGLVGIGDQSAAGNPLLEPLANNLGPTQTHRPLPGSPLIDTVPIVDCTRPDDQRGVLRPKLLGCDTGSVERRDPLFVQLESFTVEMTEGGALLRWSTSVEIDSVGFRILREQANGRQKAPTVITQHVIFAEGSDLKGADYEYLDSDKLGGVVRYYLQDIDVWGITTLHGPVTIEAPRLGLRTGPESRGGSR